MLSVVAGSGTTDADTNRLLLGVLRRSTGRADLAFGDPPSPISGGFDARLLRFRLESPPPDLDRELVARIVARSPLGRFEAEVQRRVADAGIPTPVVRLAVDDPDGLGGFVIVMDHVPGRPPLAGLGPAAVLGNLPRLTRQLPDQLASVAGRLHAVDPAPVERALRSEGTEVPITAVELAEHLSAAAEDRGRGDLVGACGDLLRHRPDGGTRAVTHGDLHPFNLIDGPDGTVLIDWTLAAIAHPAFTLAFTQLVLAHPPIALPAPARTALGPIARAMARRFTTTYRTLCPDADDHLDPTQLDWHRRLHALRILVEMSGWDGDAPVGHPWLILAPIARQILDRPRGPSS
ncbi:MAG TPA: phosphotransferase [Microthrixaceae bacterium]|nr:phosphotransferase [Microthrixaceae bacterium]